MILYLIIIIVMIVIHERHNFVEVEDPQVRSWIDPNDIIISLQQQQIKTNVLSQQNGQIQIKVFLIDQPELSYFLKIISESRTIHLKCLLHFDTIPILNPNSVLFKEINVLNQNSQYKFSVDVSRREIVCCSCIDVFWDKCSGNRIGKFQGVDPMLVIGPIVRINTQFSKIISEYRKKWQEKQIRIFGEFKYYRKFFEMQRITRKQATKISSLDLSDIEPTHNITYLFNTTHDKRKIHKNFQKNKLNLSNKSDKRQKHFQAKLQRILRCFTPISQAEKYKEKSRASQLINKILSDVKFHKIVEHQNYEQRRGFFGSIKKCTGTYVTLISKNLSVREEVRQEQKIKQEQMIRKQAKEGDRQFVAAMKIEIKALSQVKQKSCSQIAQYFLNAEEKEPKYLYSKYYSTELHQINKTKQKILILADLCLGLRFLSEQNLIHRDLKPDNLRVERKNNNDHIKIIDFGSSCPIYEAPQWSVDYNYSLPRTTRSYSVQFCQAFPQIQNLFKKQQYDQHPLYDIYAFGKIVQEFLFTNLYPHESTSKELINYLIGKCTEYNPADRLDADQLLLLLHYIFSLE